jgi:hypothetical protein
MSKDLDLRIDAPAKVSLFLYDNNTFIVESFLDEPVTIKVNAKEGVNTITDILSGEKINKLADQATGRFGRMRGDDKVNTFVVTLMPHTYRVFSK